MKENKKKKKTNMPNLKPLFNLTQTKWFKKMQQDFLYWKPKI